MGMEYLAAENARNTERFFRESHEFSRIDSEYNFSGN